VTNHAPIPLRAGQVVRRVLLRRNIVIDAEIAAATELSASPSGERAGVGAASVPPDCP